MRGFYEHGNYQRPSRNAAATPMSLPNSITNIATAATIRPASTHEGHLRNI
jgi:hypothetical protein